MKNIKNYENFLNEELDLFGKKRKEEDKLWSEHNDILNGIIKKLKDKDIIFSDAAPLRDYRPFNFEFLKEHDNHYFLFGDQKPGMLEFEIGAYNRIPPELYKTFNIFNEDIDLIVDEIYNKITND